jgi:hypothetical protein
MPGPRSTLIGWIPIVSWVGFGALSSACSVGSVVVLALVYLHNQGRAAREKEHMLVVRISGLTDGTPVRVEFLP